MINNIETEDIRYQGYSNLYRPDKGGSHFHADVFTLQEKFGYHYPIVSIKREKVRSFVSLWRHTLKMFLRMGEDESVSIMKNLGFEDILFFGENDYNLLDDEDLMRLSYDFIERNNIGIAQENVKLIKQIYQPKEWYHRNNPNIIWFDFNNLEEINSWVSKELNFDFKIVNINSSSDVECKLSYSESLNERYKSLYSKYEIFKTKKSLV